MLNFQCQVVDDTSSTFGDPTLEIVQHIANNHMDICRFKGFDDGEYEKVDAAFSHICEVKGNETPFTFRSP
jgi:hypothetical protein